MNRILNACRIRHLAATSAVVLSLAVAGTPASAWRIVYDPTNYSQNLLSAARALEQIRNQVTSLQNEAQMLINQAKNLASFPTSIIGEIEGNFSEIQNLLGQAEGLAYDVQSIEEQFTESYRTFGADMSSQDLVEGARERWNASVSAFEHSLKVGAGAVGNIEETQVQASRLVDASQAAVGVLQATQAGNQLLAVQARQVADLTALLAAQSRAEALEQARQAAAQEQAREQFRRFMTGSAYSPSSVSMFRD